MSRSERRVPKAGISVLGLWDFGSLICWTIYSRERLLPTFVRLGPLEPPSPSMVWHSMHFPLWKSCEPRDSHPVNMIKERKGTAIHVRAVLCCVITGTSKKKGKYRTSTVPPEINSTAFFIPYSIVIAWTGQLSTDCWQSQVLQALGSFTHALSSFNS